MAKEVYYFQHDYNASNDPKLSALIADFGAEGYGLWWHIIEILHQEDQHCIELKPYMYKAIARQMSASAEQVKNLLRHCVDEYELLLEDNGYVYSPRVNRNIEKRQEIKEKRREAGRKGAEKTNNKGNESANAEQVPNKSPANDRQNSAKERKGKESKESIHAHGDFQKPSIDKVKEIGNMRGITPQECENFYDKMEEKEWLRYDKTAEQWVPLVNWHNMLSRYSRNGYLRTEQDVNENKTKHTKVEVD